MRKFCLAIVILFAVPALAEKPSDVHINAAGTFDANRVLTGTFTASGAINELGSLVDTPRFAGQAVHISRLLTTSHGDYITIAINLTHVAGFNVEPPDWCPPPPTPEGTMVFFNLATGEWYQARVHTSCCREVAVSQLGPFLTLRRSSHLGQQSA